MARRKNKKKNRQQHSPPASAAKLLSQLKVCLESKRGRRAIAVAKDLLKSGKAEPEHVPLFAAAYSCRAWEMLGDGHGVEAAAMLDAVLGGHPDWAEHLDAHLPTILDSCRTDPVILAGYGQGDAALDERVTAALQTHLVDPRTLADCAGLAPEHPLRAEAILLQESWEAVESGTDSALPEGLRGISRRSPFVHWRLFVQALHAFYTRDHEAVVANTERIPATSAVRPLADALDCLERDEAPALPSGKAILAHTHGPSARAQLDAIDLALARGERRATPLANELADAFRREGRPGLAADINATVIARLGLTDRYLGGCEETVSTSPERLRRLLPRLAMAVYPDEVEDWERIVGSPGGFTPMETALLWQEAAIHSVADVLDAMPRSPFEEVPTELIALTGDYFQDSVDAFPLQQTLRAWHVFEKRMRFPDPKALDAWYADFPDDPEMWRQRVQEQRDRRDTVGSLASLEELVKRTGNSPDLVELRGHVLLDAAMISFQTGEHVEALRLTGHIEARSPLLEAGKATAEWMVADGKRERREAGARLAAVGQPLLAYHIARRFDERIRIAKLPAAVKRELRGDELIESLIVLCAVEDEIWRVLELPSQPWFADALCTARVPAPKLLQAIDAITTIPIPEIGRWQWMKHIASLTWNGLNRTAGPKAPFLAWRAYAYGKVGPDYEDHARELLAAAAWLADSEKGDMAIVDRVADLLALAGIREDAARATRTRSRKRLKEETASPVLLWGKCSDSMSGFWARMAEEEEEDDDDGWNDLPDDLTDPGVASDEIEMGLAGIAELQAMLDALPPKERERQLNQMQNALPRPFRDLPGDPLEVVKMFAELAQVELEEDDIPPFSGSSDTPEPKKPGDDDRQLKFPFF